MGYEYVCNWCQKNEDVDDDVLKELGLTIDELLHDFLCLECYVSLNEHHYIE